MNKDEIKELKLLDKTIEKLKLEIELEKLKNSKYDKETIYVPYVYPSPYIEYPRWPDSTIDYPLNDIWYCNN